VYSISVFQYANPTLIAKPTVDKSIELAKIATVYNSIFMYNLILVDQIAASTFSFMTQVTRSAAIWVAFAPTPQTTLSRQCSFNPFVINLLYSFRPDCDSFDWHELSNGNIKDVSKRRPQRINR